MHPAMSENYIQKYRAREAKKNVGTVRNFPIFPS